MTVTRARDSESQACDSGDSYQLDVALFDTLMNAKGIHRASARARQVGVARATLYRVLNHEVDVSLKVAMQFADAAGVSVHKLFELTGNPTPAPAPGPSSPPPPPGPRKA